LIKDELIGLLTSFRRLVLEKWTATRNNDCKVDVSAAQASSALQAC